MVSVHYVGLNRPVIKFSLSLFTHYSDVWYEQLNKTRSGNTKYRLSVILRRVVPCIQSFYIVLVAGRLIFSAIVRWKLGGSAAKTASIF